MLMRLGLSTALMAAVAADLRRAVELGILPGRNTWQAFDTDMNLRDCER